MRGTCAQESTGTEVTAAGTEYKRRIRRGCTAPSCCGTSPIRSPLKAQPQSSAHWSPTWTCSRHTSIFQCSGNLNTLCQCHCNHGPHAKAMNALKLGGGGSR
ncbi:hypothetical protein JG688_00007919 [Phytophthora aleatoria]|uniref:Uncharacterized protein n=1 Tax=Phytophthora aleatoria TaxID=2496075 RepID=A0A8J5J7G2_9STRA|nr:hypothetical protein JG688_00007919 [Phytophthora aleatoria]